jgi:hypothetical protein
MPDGVIAAAEKMAEEKGQPLVGYGAPLVEWSPGVAIEDEDRAPVLQEEHKDGNEPFFEDEHVQEFEEVPDDDGNDDNTEADHKLDGTDEEILEVNDVRIESENEDVKTEKSFSRKDPMNRHHHISTKRLVARAAARMTSRLSPQTSHILLVEAGMV